MRTIQELRELAKTGSLSRGEAQSEVVLRQRLIEQLIGQLYPSILRDEISEIQGLARVSETKLPASG
jgi:uncharacterized protein YnzC (UPF0291/DUF896 family)